MSAYSDIAGWPHARPLIRTVGRQAIWEEAQRRAEDVSVLAGLESGVNAAPV